MLSRVAQNIYWLSRYLERADNLARFTQVHMQLMLDAPKFNKESTWLGFITILGDEEHFQRYYNFYNEQNVIEFISLDRNNPNSILSCIRAARENAKLCRDTITSEMWECINDAYLFVIKSKRARSHFNSYHFYDRIKQSSNLFIGLAHATMSRNEAWHFSRMGRVIERADKTSRILDLPSYHDTPYEALQWSAILKSISAFEMYLKLYHSVKHRDVVDFLLFDPSFPRSIFWCITRIKESLLAINKDSPSIKEMDDILTFLDSITTENVLGLDAHHFFDEIQLLLNNVDNAISQEFFRVC